MNNINLFLFGTLKDETLFEIVLGKNLVARSATAIGYNVYRVKGEDYPILLENPKKEANGLLIESVNREVVARADFYEKIFDYDLNPVTLTYMNKEVSSFVYMPQNYIEPVYNDWKLTEWQETSGKRTRAFARKVMSEFGKKSSSEIKAKLNSYF